MGVVANIRHNQMPEQGTYLNRRVEVCFHFDARPEHILKGKIVRDDAEHPFRTIILLDNGTALLTTECQYSLVKEN